MCKRPVLLESPNLARLVYPVVTGGLEGVAAGAGGVATLGFGITAPELAFVAPPSFTIVTPPDVLFTSLCDIVDFGRLL